MDLKEIGSTILDKLLGSLKKAGIFLAWLLLAIYVFIIVLAMTTGGNERVCYAGRIYDDPIEFTVSSRPLIITDNNYMDEDPDRDSSNLFGLNKQRVQWTTTYPYITSGNPILIKITGSWAPTDGEGTLSGNIVSSSRNVCDIAHVRRNEMLEVEGFTINKEGKVIGDFPFEGNLTKEVMDQEYTEKGTFSMIKNFFTYTCSKCSPNRKGEYVGCENINGSQYLSVCKDFSLGQRRVYKKALAMDQNACFLYGGTALYLGFFGENGDTMPTIAHHLETFQRVCPAKYCHDTSGKIINPDKAVRNCPVHLCYSQESRGSSSYKVDKNEYYYGVLKEGREGVNSRDYDGIQMIKGYDNGKLIFAGPDEHVKLVIYDDYYHDNTGSYTVTFLEGLTKKVDIGTIGAVVAEIEKVFIGSKDQERVDGLLYKIYNNIIINVSALVRYSLTAYIMFMGLGVLLGTVELSQKELMKRLFIIGIVILFTSLDSWLWFNRFFMGFFIDGLDTVLALIGNVIEKAFENDMVDYYKADFSGTGGKFSFIDGVYQGFIFAKPTQSKILGLIFATWYGFLIVPLVYAVLLYFALVILTSAYPYLLSIIQLSVVMALSPLAFIALFYKRTEKMFDKWLTFIGMKCFEILILFTFLYIFIAIIENAFLDLFDYETCSEVFFTAIFGGEGNRTREAFSNFFSLGLRVWDAKIPGTSSGDLLYGGTSSLSQNPLPFLLDIIKIFVWIMIFKEVMGQMSKIATSLFAFGSTSGNFDVGKFADTGFGIGGSKGTHDMIGDAISGATGLDKKSDDFKKLRGLPETALKELGTGLVKYPGKIAFDKAKEGASNLWAGAKETASALRARSDLNDGLTEAHKNGFSGEAAEEYAFKYATSKNAGRSVFSYNMDKEGKMAESMKKYLHDKESVDPTKSMANGLLKDALKNAPDGESIEDRKKRVLDETSSLLDKWTKGKGIAMKDGESRKMLANMLEQEKMAKRLKNPKKEDFLFGANKDRLVLDRMLAAKDKFDLQTKGKAGERDKQISDLRKKWKDGGSQGTFINFARDELYKEIGDDLKKGDANTAAAATDFANTVTDNILGLGDASDLVVQGSIADAMVQANDLLLNNIENTMIGGGSNKNASEDEKLLEEKKERESKVKMAQLKKKTLKFKKGELEGKKKKLQESGAKGTDIDSIESEIRELEDQIKDQESQISRNEG